jgi:hypothetical protein
VGKQEGRIPYYSSLVEQLANLSPVGLLSFPPLALLSHLPPHLRPLLSVFALKQKQTETVSIMLLNVCSHLGLRERKRAVQTGCATYRVRHKSTNSLFLVHNSLYWSIHQTYLNSRSIPAM